MAEGWFLARKGDTEWPVPPEICADWNCQLATAAASGK
jgi:hypothetical protein